jgi:hypothetical protein
MKDFTPHKEALALKELGFDEPCFMIYYNGTDEMRGEGHFLFGRDTKAPTFSQAFRFFREKYKLDSYVKHEAPDVEAYYEIVIGDDVFDVQYDTHEEAELECLRKLIKIAKQKP